MRLSRKTYKGILFSPDKKWTVASPIGNKSLNKGFTSDNENLPHVFHVCLL